MFASGLDADAAKKIATLKKKFGEWASPYDCYRIAVTNREEEQLKKRAVEDERTAKKSKWSHHDPSSGRGSKPREVSRNLSSIIVRFDCTIRDLHTLGRSETVDF